MAHPSCSRREYVLVFEAASLALSLDPASRAGATLALTARLHIFSPLESVLRAVYCCPFLPPFCAVLRLRRRAVQCDSRRGGARGVGSAAAGASARAQRTRGWRRGGGSGPAVRRQPLRLGRLVTSRV